MAGSTALSGSGLRPYQPRERAVDKRGRDDLYIRDRWYRERAGAGQRGCGREGREDIRRANTIDQFAKAGLVDEVQFHLAPVILGSGVRLFENVGEEGLDLEKIRLLDSPGVTHISFRVARQGT